MVVNIIGAGLAGCECAYILSKYNIKSRLYEMKPKKKSPAHVSDNFAELVCSNSLKSADITNACGLLKEEMRMLGSLFVAGKAANDIESYRHTQGGRSNGTETIYGDTRREMVRGVGLRLRPVGGSCRLGGRP